jgi:O-antigen/teichoic acid export membrane protein
MNASLVRLTARVRASDLVRHGSLVFAGIILANAFMYVYYALVGRIVGVAAYGVVSALFSATLIIATAPATMAATVVSRVAAGLYAQNAAGRLRRLGDLMSAASIALAALSLLSVAASSRVTASYLHIGTVAPVIATGFVLATAFALPLQRSLMQGTQHFREFSLSMIIETTGKAIAGPVLALWFGATGALAGLAVGAAISGVYNVIVLRRLYGARPERLRLNLRAMFGSSAAAGTAVIVINVLLFYDVILVRHIFPPVEAGLYGAASLVGRALYTVVSFIPTIVLPKAVAQVRATAPARPLLPLALGVAIAISGGALACIALIPGWIVGTLAGKAFVTAAPYVLPYTLALSLLALANIVAMYKIGIGKHAFVVPLCLVAIAEIVTIVIWHPTVSGVLLVLVVGHSGSFLATLLGVRSASRAAVPGDA